MCSGLMPSHGKALLPGEQDLWETEVVGPAPAGLKLMIHVLYQLSYRLKPSS